MDVVDEAVGRGLVEALGHRVSDNNAGRVQPDDHRADRRLPARRNALRRLAGRLNGGHGGLDQHRGAGSRQAATTPTATGSPASAAVSSARATGPMTAEESRSRAVKR